MEKIEALKALLVNYFEEEIPEDFEDLITIKGYRFNYNSTDYIILNKKEIDQSFSDVSEEEIDFLQRDFNNSDYSFLNSFIDWEGYRKSIESDYDFNYIFGTDEEYVINEYIILI